MPLSIETLKALKYLKTPETKVDGIEWSVREKLALSSAVLETGQEYWPTISRLIQPFGSDHRLDKSWCSSKECAKQYSKILDNISTKKRNENTNSSLPLKDLIVKKLTVERIEELQDDIRREQEKQIALKKMLSDLESGSLDEKVSEIWNHLKENADFDEYLKEVERANAEERLRALEQESETTDAMTSSCMDEESNSDDDQKPRLVIHLKKSAKRNADLRHNDLERKVKCRKIESYQDSEGSGDTDPAVFDSDAKSEVRHDLKTEVIKIEVGKLSPKVAVDCKSSIKIKSPGDSSRCLFSNLSNVAWVKQSKVIINLVLDDPNSHVLDSCILMKSDSQYKNIVKKILNPVDVRNNLRDNRYSSPHEFEHDLLLVLCNAVIYYPMGSHSNKIARNIYDKITPLLECMYETDGANTSSVSDAVSRRSTRKSLLGNTNTI